MKIFEFNLFDSIIGGTESYLAHLARIIHEDGHKIVHLFIKKNEGGSGLVPAIPRWYFPHLSPQYFPDFFRFYHSTEVKNELREFRQLLAQERPEILHFNNIYNPVYFRRLARKIPSVRTVHDYRFTCPTLCKILPPNRGICPFPVGWSCFREGCLDRKNLPVIKEFFFLLHERELTRHFSTLIVKSRYMKEVLVANGFHPNRIQILPLSTTIPAEIIPPPRHRLLFVGRLAPEKGLELLFKAFTFLPPNVEFTVGGDGPERENLERLARDLGISARVKFKGWLSPAALSQEYRQSTFLAVPSIWPEPFGLVGLEAMAHARPVIAFAVGGIPEWLQDQVNGFLVPRGDLPALVEKMKLLLQDPGLAAKLGENGRKIAIEKYELKKNAMEMVKLFQKFVSL